MSEPFNPAEAVAILTVATPDGQVFTDIFTESDGVEVRDALTNEVVDPYRRAIALRDSVLPDFPGALASIALTERARNMATAARMRAMGWADYTHEDAAKAREEQL